MTTPLPGVARAMSWLDVPICKDLTRFIGAWRNVVESNLFCGNKVPTDSTDITSVVERWIVFLPFLDELEPFMCLISHYIYCTIVTTHQESHLLLL